MCVCVCVCVCVGGVATCPCDIKSGDNCTCHAKGFTATGGRPTQYSYQSCYKVHRSQTDRSPSPYLPDGFHSRREINVLTPINDHQSRKQ